MRARLLKSVSGAMLTPLPDLICYSHLRWDFVWQRPQHLMTRAAATRRVWFVEEPVLGDASRLDVRVEASSVRVVQPVIAPWSDREQQLRHLIGESLAKLTSPRPIGWYYTPMALEYSSTVDHSVVIYDCMDQLSAFAGAPPELPERERLLMEQADLVFTGGVSLYEAKRERHRNVHLFPSSVDAAHFRRARRAVADPSDQAPIPRPRLGYCGVLDERLDCDLIARVAEARPAWQFVLVGPVVKIDPASLPQGANLHYLGMKSYESLPTYLSGWDVAMLPFARNEATRFISPTKTPEYLAAGRAIVSTSIRDVVNPYGALGLAAIADTPAEFIAAVTALLETPRASLEANADAFLGTLSWDSTWREMQTLIDAVATDRLGRELAATAPLAGTPEEAPPPTA